MQRVKPLFRVLSLFLCLCLLIMSCFVPYAEAVFIESAAVAYAYELLAAALVAGGLVAANSDDIISISAAVYKWAKDKADPLCDTLLGIARQAFSFAGDITSTAWRVGSDVWSSIVDLLTSHGFGTGSVAISDGKSILIPDRAAMQSLDYRSLGLQRYEATDEISSHVLTYELIPDSSVSTGYSVYFEFFSYWSHNLEEVSGSRRRFVAGYPETSRLEYYTPDCEFYFALVFSSSGTWVQLMSYSPAMGNSACIGQYKDSSSLPLTLLLSPTEIISASGTLTYPGDQTMVLAPPLPTTTADPDTGKEIVVVPPISVIPDDWTADFPQTSTGEQVDVPTDTLVDVGTGEAVGEGEIPDVGTDTGKGILDAIKNFFDSPSDFKLNFDAFKNVILTDRFPFCIPFDFVNCIKVWGRAAADYHLRIDLDTTYMSIHQDIDLTPFALPIAFFRYGATVWFAISLILKTRGMIKW